MDNSKKDLFAIGHINTSDDLIKMKLNGVRYRIITLGHQNCLKVGECSYLLGLLLSSYSSSGNRLRNAFCS